MLVTTNLPVVHKSQMTPVWSSESDALDMQALHDLLKRFRQTREPNGDRNEIISERLGQSSLVSLDSKLQNDRNGTFGLF